MKLFLITYGSDDLSDTMSKKLVDHFSPFLNCGYFVTVLILVNDLIISSLFLFVSEKKAPELWLSGAGAV